METRLGFFVIWLFEEDMPYDLQARVVESYFKLALCNLPCGIRLIRLIGSGDWYIGKEAIHGVFCTYSLTLHEILTENYCIPKVSGQ